MPSFISLCTLRDASPRNTYLLTPWCWVLLEKLTGLQLVQKFPAFHGTPRFITALTTVRHLSLSWASPIQSIYPHPTSWRSILILSTHLRLGLPSVLFPFGFPTKTLYDPLSSPIRATCPAHLILLDFIIRTIYTTKHYYWHPALCLSSATNLVVMPYSAAIPFSTSKNYVRPQFRTIFNKVPPLGTSSGGCKHYIPQTITAFYNVSMCIWCVTFKPRSQNHV